MGPAHHEIVALSADQFVFVEDAPLECVYHLLDGKVSLWKKKKKFLTLSKACVLGIEGFFNNSEKYVYTVKTETDCRCAVYGPDQVQELMYSSSRFVDMVVASLSEHLTWVCELLGHVGASQTPTYYAADIRTYVPGEYVIREGEISREMYRIISTDKGLEVSKQGTRLAVLREPGQFFGEMAAVLKEVRTASVQTLGRTVLEVYPEHFLSVVLQDYPEVAQNLVTGLSQRLHGANQLLVTKK